MMQLTQALQAAANHFQAGRMDEAETACRAVIEQQPGMTDALHLLALVMRKQGNLDEAEALFRSCLEKRRDRADIHANYGNLLRAAGRTEEAIAEYHKALDLDSYFRPARIALARAFISQAHYTHALAEAETLLEQDDGDAEAWATYGTARRGMEDLAEAEVAYRKAIKLKPGYGPAHHDLGALLS
jgi:Tfp pilus assembly protein PilF